MTKNIKTLKMKVLQKTSFLIIRNEIYCTEKNASSFISIKGVRYYRTTKARARQLGFKEIGSFMKGATMNIPIEPIYKERIYKEVA
jgi:hypothetical protein